MFFILSFIWFAFFVANGQPSGKEDRDFWLSTLNKIADPVLVNLANNALKKSMPYESLSPDRQIFSYLEAVGRLLCGISSWLELGPENTDEGKLRGNYINLTLKGLKNAVNPSAPDYLSFGEPTQALVDTAFLAQALLRAPTQLWGNLDTQAKEWMITELKRSRSIQPPETNWLLFASMVETALMEFTGEYNETRLMYGINKFRTEWYKGDSFYGDGVDFHMDYYNSFVIHPMLTDILTVLKKHNHEAGDFLSTHFERQVRYAEILERFISPEGTYPVVGRSIAYRFGVFHALSQIALMDKLPATISRGQVRSGLTSVISRELESPKNFDEGGWLRVGLTGTQINISETYINTGSVYLCAFIFLPLGLPSTHPFWTEDFVEWTNLKAWSGKEVFADHAL